MLRPRVVFSLAWLLLLSAVSALKGFEGAKYYPMCAHGCLRAFSTVLQTCSTPDDPVRGEMVINHATHPHCYAESEPYLTSLAYCVSQECASEHLGILDLETFWAKYSTGTLAVAAKWTYSEALSQVKTPPNKYVVGKKTTVLNETLLANGTSMTLQKNTLTSVEYESNLEGQYGNSRRFFALPIVITLVGYLPFMTTLSHKVKPYLIWPSVVGTYHVRPLPYNLGNAPTLGQALFAGAFIIVNVVMSATDYRVAIPHAWYGSDKLVAVEAYVMWRTGAIPLIILPLVMLFSGRNNVLLWLTNWSHSTYMVLHRWVARVFAIHVIIHSILGLDVWIRRGDYAEDSVLPWWIWGIIGTIATTIMLVGSGLYVRRWSYEVFLIVHIIMAAFVIIGTWYHIWFCFKWRGNYQQPMYAAIGVWVFDRVLRVLRVAKNGVRRACVTDIGEGYVRIDIPGVRWGTSPGLNAYAYFPTIHKMRPWENHPFSVLPTSLFAQSPVKTHTPSSGSRNGSAHEDDIEGKGSISLVVDSESHSRRFVNGSTTSGVTLFVRKASGITRHLTRHDNLLTLLDGPYPSTPTSGILRTDRLLVITGGIGISGVLPWMFAHPNAKLAWSVKKSAECLVTSLDVVLASIADKQVQVGSRLDINALIDQEVAAGWHKIGVVVCGPGELCDTVRTLVCAAAKGPTLFEMEVEAYSW